MLSLLLLACGSGPVSDSSNLCGTIDRPLGAPAATEVNVVAVLDGATACQGGDTGGGGWWGEVVASPTPDGDHFEATVPAGSYGVEVSTDGDFSGCAAAEVTDDSTCSADITVTLAESVPVDKPNLYLYPTAPTDVSVRLPAWRRVTESEPRYPVDGWRVRAWPDGRLDTNVGQRDYLFYEMNYDADKFQTRTGWCVQGPLAQQSIADAMADLGFLPNEIGDFATAWDGEFPETDQMTIYPQFEGLAVLHIEPQPDSLLRAWFLVAPGCRKVEPAVFPVVERVGYHAAEWGVAFESSLPRSQVMVFGG